MFLCPECNGRLYTQNSLPGGVGRQQFRLRKYICSECQQMFRTREENLTPIATPRKLTHIAAEIEQEQYDRATQAE